MTLVSVSAESSTAIKDLRGLGLTPILLAGDNAAVAREVAAQVGIDRVHAEVTPAQKVSLIAKLQQEGRVVAMAGDGINAAAALAASDLGIAMGTGTDVAIEAFDLTLVKGDLATAVDAVRLSRSTLRTIRATCSGPLPTTWLPYRSRRWASSIRSSQAPPWRSVRCSS